MLEDSGKKFEGVPQKTFRTATGLKGHGQQLSADLHLFQFLRITIGTVASVHEQNMLAFLSEA